MKYIRVKKYGETKRKRKNGTRQVDLYYIEKTYKRGEEIDNQFIPKSKNILITGPNGSRKTITIEKIHEHALDIWGGHTKAKNALFLDGFRNQSDWYEQEQIKEYYNSLNSDIPWYKLRAGQKTDIMIDFASQDTVLCLANAHRLTGNKAEIATKCIKGAKRFVITTTRENSLPDGMRGYVLKFDPFTVRFQSDDSTVDYSNALLWVLIVSALVVDAHIIAFALGGLKFLGRGYGANKQS